MEVVAAAVVALLRPLMGRRCSRRRQPAVAVPVAPRATTVALAVLVALPQPVPRMMVTPAVPAPPQALVPVVPAVMPVRPTLRRTAAMPGPGAALGLTEVPVAAAALQVLGRRGPRPVLVVLEARQARQSMAIPM